MDLPIRPAEGRETAQAPIPYSSSGSRERRRFWEIDSHFKCPLVGMCLSLSEQRQLLKKAGVSLKGKTPFMIHEVLVACSDRQNPLSKKVDGRLNRKKLPADRIFFKGEKGFRMAPRGSRVLVVNGNRRPPCDGRCENCTCRKGRVVKEKG